MPLIKQWMDTHQYPSIMTLFPLGPPAAGFSEDFQLSRTQSKA